jgi:hypothetical protein
VSLKERVEQVLKDGTGRNIDLTNRYAIDEAERGWVRVGARHQINVVDYLGGDTW